MKKKTAPRKKHTNAKEKVYKGIKFKSQLECFMYKLLDDSGVPFEYEGKSFEVDSGFVSPNKSFERFLNGKGEFKDRGGKKYAPSVYTPDFVNKGEKLIWVIEVKGRSFAGFPERWRKFKKLLLLNGEDSVVLYCPRNQEDCRETMKSIRKLCQVSR